MRFASVCMLALAILGRPAHAQLAEVGTFVASELLKGIGSKLVGEALDNLWGKDVSPDQRVAELQGTLAAYESGLRQVDARLADQVSALRKDLSSRTTADDVRRIVNQTLAALEERTAKLESRTGKLENRQDAIDSRIRALEDFFGYIPTVPPAPLLASASQEAGKPAAHPMMVEWLNLLLRSEESRHLIDDLRRTRPDTSKVLQAALAKDKELLSETQALHAKVMKELAEKLAERQALLAEFKRDTPEVRKFEESLSSVTWLAAVTRPVPKGPYAGRLAVPQALFGFDAPEVVSAFDAAKADRTQVVALYQQSLLDEAVRKPFLGVSIDRATLTAEMTGVGREAGASALKGFDLARSAQKIDRELQAALSSCSEQSPEVKARRGEQIACMTEIRGLHKEFEDELKRAIATYVEAIHRERPSNARMHAFREGVLLPLASWERLTRSRETGVDSECWARVKAYGLTAFTLEGFAEEVLYLSWSPDGKRLATACLEETTVKIWDAESGKNVFMWDGVGGRYRACSAAWSSDGKRIAVGTYGFGKSYVLVWDAETGNLTNKLFGHGDPGAENGGENVSIEGLAWSPDGKRLAASCFGETAKVLDVETGEALFTLTAVDDAPQSVAWSPDGKRLATAKSPWGVTVRAAETGKELLRLSEQEYVSSVAWSPDGKRLAVGTSIWDAETAKELVRLTGNTIGGLVAWSPDGKRLATASSWKTGGSGHALKVWDAETGKELLSLTEHSEDVYFVAWSPDGKRLATANRDKTATLWPVEEALTRASQKQ